ncbi:MAG: caspase family protein [Thermoguttaceae bacterium]|nr:caspase family protein [Thermoguttaceae bacterium]
MEALKGCANDAKQLKSWFETAYAEKGALTVLSDGDAEALGASATPDRANIMNALTEKAGKECDRLIVTFAGHGVNWDGKSFLCPSDVKGTSFAGAEGRSAVLKKGLDNNLIAVEDVLNVLKNATAKEVVVVFDACRDNDVENADFAREFTDMLANEGAGFQRKNGGFFVLTSCSTGEKAKEITVGGKIYGAFTYYFVEGLKGKADFAECCDGYVTLNEAYNYAQSMVRDKQSPELFMASTQMANLPTMTRVDLDDFAASGASLAEVERWSDAEFLLRSGYALSRSNLTPKPLRVGEKALSAALTCAPNNALAWELRGSARRSLGDFEGALSDLEQVGRKLQLYVKSTHSARGNVPAGADAPRSAEEWNNVELINDQSEKTGAKAETFDLLTVSKFKDGWAWIAEKNNEPLGAQAGWVPVDKLTWHYSIAASVVNASKAQATQRSSAISATARQPSSGLSPGGTSQMGPMSRPGGVTPW